MYNSLAEKFKIFSDFYESKKYNMTFYYRNIPNNKKLYPTVFLRYKDDKVIVSDNNWKAINLKQKIKEDKKKENNNQIGLKANIKKEQKDEKEGIKEPIIGRGLGRGRGLPLRFFGRRPGFRNRIGIRIGIRGLRRRR